MPLSKRILSKDFTGLLSLQIFAKRYIKSDIYRYIKSEYHYHLLLVSLDFWVETFDFFFLGPVESSYRKS